MCVRLKLFVIVSCVVLCQTYAKTTKKSDSILGNAIEEFVKNLFNREMSSANNQNLTDCVTRLLCENICARTVKGEIKEEVLLGAAQLMGRSESDPLGYFFTGGDKGYQFGQLKDCGRCANKYHNCLPLQYQLTKATSAGFEKTMLEPAVAALEPRKRRSSLFDL